MRAYERLINAAVRPLGVQVSRIGSDARRLPVEATACDAAAIEALRPYTMTSATRLWSLLNAVRHVEAEGIEGDFVECGVWRGGSVMAMAGELQRLGSQSRRIWLYDTFQGMTPPTAEDVEAGTGTTAADMLATTPVGDGNNVWCIAGIDDVRGNVLSTGYPEERFVFVMGDVAVTLQESRPSRIALLRLDTDWYASTKAGLEALYPLLAVGGLCILDDYGHWQGARQAVDDYFAERDYVPLMHPIDYSGRIFRKTRELAP